MGHVVARGLRAPTPGMLLKPSPQSSQAWCLCSSDYTSAPRAQCDAIKDGSPMAPPSSVRCRGGGGSAYHSGEDLELTTAMGPAQHIVAGTRMLAAARRPTAT